MEKGNLIKSSTVLQKVLENKLGISYVVGLLCFRAVLDLVYVKNMATTFNYTGMTLNYSGTSIGVSWILFFLCIPVVYKVAQTENFSGLILMNLILLSYIPFTTMVAFFNFGKEYVIANTVYWGVLVFTIVFLPTWDFQLAMSVSTRKNLMIGIIIIFALTIIYISGRYTGFRFTLDMSSVYEMRDEARVLNLPTIIKYLFSGSKAVFPVILVYALKNKKKILVIGIVLLQILSFSINGSKTVLFSTVVTIGVYFFYKEQGLKLFPWILVAICLLGYLEERFAHSININAYVTHRVFFFPNQLGYNYYDFFTTHEPDYFRQGFLRWFGFISPYELETSHLIGDVYYSQVNMGANNGLISDAITNLGRAGIVVMPIILGSVLRLFDIAAIRIDRKIYIVTAITYSFIILSSFLFTVMLTHGMFAVLFVFFILNEDILMSGQRIANSPGKYLKY